VSGGGAGALLVSPFNMKWRCYVQAGVVEESKFCLFLVVFPVRCISSISPRFYFRRHTFCFLPLATILELSLVFIYLFYYLFIYFLKFLFFYYSYVHTMLGSFLPTAPTPPLPPCSLPVPHTPSIPGRNYFALISNFVEERV
jgi:hypothetical protein